MALTRKMLKAMGIEDEKLEQIIEAHAETVNALKDERDAAKGEADKVSELRKQLEAANEKLESVGNDEFKAKFESEHAAFEEFKANIAAEKDKAAKTELYRKLLKDTGVDEKRLASILKVSDIDSLTVTENGTLENVEKLTESIKSDWSDFIVSNGTSGAGVDTPPGNGGDGGQDLSKMSMSEYIQARKNKN